MRAALVRRLIHISEKVAQRLMKQECLMPCKMQITLTSIRIRLTINPIEILA